MSVLLCTLSLGCGTLPPPSEPPVLDRAAFEADIYPLLLRDCGFPACHASTLPGLEEANSPDNNRDTASLRVSGPGRARLDPATPLSAPFVEEEITDAFERARANVFPGEDCGASPLVRKPLEVDAGGAAHKGDGVHGRDVYATVDHPSYQILLAWTCGQTVATPATEEENTEEVVDENAEQDAATVMGAQP